MIKDAVMERTRTYGSKATGFLSAFFLCLAAVLAGAYGPLTAVEPTVSASSARTGGVDSRDQQSSPTTSKRPFVAVEWRNAKAVLAQGEGKSKAALPPAGPSVPDLGRGLAPDEYVERAELCQRFDGYGARAPPAFSDHA